MHSDQETGFLLDLSSVTQVLSQKSGFSDPMGIRAPQPESSIVFENYANGRYRKAFN